MSDAAILTEQLTRKFGELTAVDRVDLRVTAGQFFGFLGPNGAGKSTTIKMLTGLLTPTAGRMQLLGIDFPGILSTSNARLESCPKEWACLSA